jgi:hypothetical protein
MKIAYISGPYRADSPNGIYHNIQKARKVAIKYWGKGYAVICPHLNTAFMDGACPDHVWLEGDVEILKRCDLVVMMKGWEKSEGARHEYKVANAYMIKTIED